ncbi:DUF4006 family protein [Sulfurimonas sp. C5]|uniref:DUF4006 family protein n=1 Tax=Sulfurimonas sp. C5 TaxID=3036947 RepID=UPI0024571D6B|nr:DUF4006 family protein [Sulfurimonas sp. C5]MDH4944390.1 DUF4006 family protein [Sulfurimonas sp. C5]
MNENRSVFALDGVTGMLIATVLLLSILVGLTIAGLGVQNANAENFYEVKNETSIGSGIGFGEGHTTSKAEDHIVSVSVKK